jgi:hypothetical protein
MKTKIENFKIFAFAIIIATLSLNVYNNVLAQNPLPPSCPPGYVYLEEYVNITIDDIICRYKVGLCVSCPAGTSPIPFTIMLETFTADSIDCGFDPSEVEAAILDIITDPLWIDANIDCFAGWGPCRWNAVEIIGVTPLCWKKGKLLDDDNQIMIIYSGCYEEGCTCQRIKTICWEGNQFIITEGPFQRVPELCQSPCESFPEPADEEIPDPTDEEPFPESPFCFGIDSPCD